MYLPGAERPTFKRANSCCVKANSPRPETVLPAVLTSPHPWLITLLRLGKLLCQGTVHMSYKNTELNHLNGLKTLVRHLIYCLVMTRQ